LEFNFNNNPPGLSLVPPAAAADETRQAEQPAPTPAAPAPATSDQSAAFVRFRSCRWHQPLENGNSEFCTHREVKPYAGTSGFDADAWCPDCQYYKLRRAPRKRENNNDYSY
jgi:hypothetical protein